jgi:hypothetical protein
VALDYSISEENRLVRVVYRGVSTFPEWIETMNKILKDPRFRPGFAFLIDRRAVPPPEVSFTEDVVRWLERHKTQLGSDHRSATVVTDNASYGMARMIQGLTGSSNIRVFTNLAEAEEWLTASTNRKPASQSAAGQ